MPQKFFIDTDTASDDAVALMLAFAAPDIEVVGISIVAGNVPLEIGIQNAGFIARLYEQQVPIYAGAAKPLTRPLETAQFVHGEDGMGDIGLPLKGTTASTGHAADALISAAGANENLTLVTLGPLTNVAIALLKEPSLAQSVNHCFIMGGTSDYIGNVVPFAEYNVWVDPEAADIVFGSGMKITMIGWDISRKDAFITPDQAAEIRAIDTEKARIAIDIQACLTQFITKLLGHEGFDLPDPIAMAVAIDPSIIERSLQAAVFVAPGVDPQRGVTFIEPKERYGRKANCTICTKVSHEKFITMLKNSLQ